MLYRILLAIDGLAALVALGFFAAGTADGTVSSDNIVLWLLLLAGVGAFPIAGINLHKYGKLRAANRVLLGLAIPAISVALLILLMIILQPRWN